MIQLTKNNLLKPADIREIILEDLGISSIVKIIDGKTAIKVDNHFSLFTLISKLRRDFSFTIYHKKDENSYILYLEQ